MKARDTTREAGGEINKENGKRERELENQQKLLSPEIKKYAIIPSGLAMLLQKCQSLLS